MANRARLADLEEFNDEARGTRSNIVDMTGEDDDNDDPNTAALIDLTDLNDEDETGIDEDIHDVSVDASIGRILAGCVRLDSVKLRAETVFSGDGVELKHGLDDTPQTFLCDVLIFQHTITGEIFFHGVRAWRTTSLEGMLSNRINELCLILDAPPSATDPTFNQCRVLKKLTEARAKRRIILTNRPFPTYSVWEPPYYGLTKEELRAKAQLVCRWRLTRHEMNSGQKITNGSMRRLSTDEYDQNFCDEDVLRLRSFLTQKQKPAQHQQRKRTHNEDLRNEEEAFHRLVHEPINLPAARSVSKKRKIELNAIYLTTETEDDVSVIEERVVETIQHLSTAGKTETLESTVAKTIRTQRSIKTAFSLTKTRPTFSNVTRNVQSQNPRKFYSFGDICSGAGGTASGAVQAGLRLNFLLDNWVDACETLGLNFDTKILAQDVHRFCHPSRTSTRDYEECDVLHISFPCQSHSLMNTTGGRNFDQNIATGYSVEPILKRCKPRVVTFEQTDGILKKHGGEHFRTLIRQITDEGYSVRWKVCRAADLETRKIVHVSYSSRLAQVNFSLEFLRRPMGPGRSPTQLSKMYLTG